MFGKRAKKLVRGQRGGGGACYVFAGLVWILTLGVVAGCTAALGTNGAQGTARAWAYLGTLLGLLLAMAGLGLDVRGDPLGILAAGRNRYSLARLQMALWSWIILGGLIAAAVCRAWGLGGGTLTGSLSIEINDNLLAVMGISYFTGAATPALLSVKSGYASVSAAPLDTRSTDNPIAVVGQMVYRPARFRARFADLVEGDEASNAGSIDLSKVQQLIITVALVGTYAAALFQMFAGSGFSVPMKGGGIDTVTRLPDFSADLMKLLLVSHVGYLGYSAVPKPPAAQAPAILTEGPPPTPVLPGDTA